MAATMATMAILNPKSLLPISKPNPSKPISILSTQNLPKGLTCISPQEFSLSSSLTKTALAGAFFSALASCDSALAAQQIAQIAEGDNRGLALLLPLVPALAWVLFNILQPALNQLNKMRNTKGVAIGIGLGGLAGLGLVSAPHASAAQEVVSMAEATGDNRGQLLLIVVAPALLWVAYNILQPALNQLNRMRSD